ncbi:MAG: FtsX-like permease family protein [Clostridiales bacterium]|nr:FtsX-like permease family protein [Clostridiales bacterium]
MIIGIKDALKLIGISVIACCAIFVCTLFLNYNLDIANIKNEIKTEPAAAMYNAIVSSGKVTCAVTGGCLVITSVIMLLFYIKNYIDSHGKELGILKALGYSNIKIAKHFWIFGSSIFVGCALGFISAFIYIPSFYEIQNTAKLLPEITVQFYPVLAVILIAVPTILFIIVSILYAYFKLNTPILNLLKENSKFKFKIGKAETKDLPFLQDLKQTVRKSKKTLVFLIAFSAFCFSAMTQMAFSMKNLASETMAFMILSIGLILAFMTLLLSLTTVVKANTKTIAMMRIFGYQYNTCSKAVLGGYRPISYIGFAIGTVYQYLLLKIMVTIVFANIESMPEYNFDFIALIISFIVFVIAYELIIHIYSFKIKKLSIKSIMSE